MIQEEIKKLIRESLEKLGIDAPEISLEHPDEISHGDFSTNVALACSKRTDMNPRELAQKILEILQKNKSRNFNRIEIAGPGFINFHLSREFFSAGVAHILKEGENFGKNNSLSGKKVLIEYTDPNAFKVFHIGHLMSNALGESISRHIEFSKAKVTRLCYPSDIGLHIAKAVWGCIKNAKEFPKDSDSLTTKTEFLGKAYVEGTASYESDPEAKANIDVINRQLFEKSNKEVMRVYEKGREWSFAHFEELYKRLGTKFDGYIYESEAAPIGLKLVKEFLERGIFEMSEGAIVFHGEKHGLHTRVFVNSQGFPTYEAKEIGLNRIKFDKWNPDLSVIVTANEQNEYFKVVSRPANAPATRLLLLNPVNVPAPYPV
jgi:arginyl-tRNA synthetase